MCREHEIWAVVEAVVLVMEVCGSRFEGGTRQGFQKVADFSSNVAVLTGPHLTLQQAGQLPRMQASIAVDGQTCVSGTGANGVVAGHPIQSLIWLANDLAQDGLQLYKGDLVITGAMCKCTHLQAGSQVVATFSDLGEVELVVT